MWTTATRNLIGRLAHCLHEGHTARRQETKLKGHGPKAEALLAILAQDPYRTPPPFEKLVGDLTGAYSHRINIQHRLVYQLLDEDRVVKVLRMWSHYE